MCIRDSTNVEPNQNVKMELITKEAGRVEIVSDRELIADNKQPSEEQKTAAAVKEFKRADSAKEDEEHKRMSVMISELLHISEYGVPENYPEEESPEFPANVQDVLQDLEEDRDDSDSDSRSEQSNAEGKQKNNEEKINELDLTYYEKLEMLRVDLCEEIGEEEFLAAYKKVQAELEKVKVIEDLVCTREENLLFLFPSATDTEHAQDCAIRLVTLLEMEQQVAARGWQYFKFSSFSFVFSTRLIVFFFITVYTVCVYYCHVCVHFLQTKMMIVHSVHLFFES
eukprot:TRINITY_DN8019_c0_g1_i2.p1 TRINITY_DN8019_c0_g1~~TRINITY_DN8019_c0_g1_i2.p1  ORF type:complete len:283 (+),score=44.83 TRINITY_DN8019_c0_g1_i2:64-912(+)